MRLHRKAKPHSLSRVMPPSVGCVCGSRQGQNLLPHHSAQRGSLGYPSIIHPVKLMLLTCKLVWLVAAQQLQEQAFQKYRFLGCISEVNQFLHVHPDGGLDPQPGWKTSATGPPFQNPPSGPLVTLSCTARLPHPASLLSTPQFSQICPTVTKKALVGVQQ